jgi:chromosome segregation ATPase
MKKIFLMPMIILAFASCNTKQLETENAALIAKMDSLNIQIENDKLVGQELVKITDLIDAIDKEREDLRINLETGIQPDDYEAKMKGIQTYLKQAQKRMADLDKTSATYSALVKKLQKELVAKNTEISKLKELVSTYQQENEGLISKVNLQAIEIQEKNQLIEIKQQELTLIEAKVVEIMKQANVSEAEAYLARGEAIEMAATRTKLASKKRKQTYKEALQMYNKSLELGHPDAQKKVTALEAKLK